MPLIATVAALQQGNSAVMGVIASPAPGRILFAAKGSGALRATNTSEAKRMMDLDRRVARVSRTAELAEAALTSGALELHPQLEMNDGIERLFAKTKVSPGWIDCYGHYLVTARRAYVMVDPKMHV